MKAPLSWIKQYVEIDDINIEELAKILTMVGLEVDGITLVGLPMPPAERHEFKYSGLTWQKDKFIVAQVDEVMPHPNADRLVLCRLNDGEKEIIVLTGAPNLFQYRGTGTLAQPLKVAYALEGAELYDGHQPGNVLTKLKRMKIRGVESFSMICSEKELGISDEHDGVIILDADAPTGMPLVDYMGDAVFELSTLPNMIRAANIWGVAREIAAATNRVLHKPNDHVKMEGKSIEGRAKIEIKDPQINPRFILGLLEGATAKPSPYWVQRRLSLAGMRPINAIVDATNYVMLEVGEPLHAFDYDTLKTRAGGNTPTIITRTANPGEKLTTLDDNTHELEPYMELVTDTAGALSLAGVMGGKESEVNDQTMNVLLEGAAWNFINVRKAVTKLRIASEAGYRFSRGIHPEMAGLAVRMCLEYMRQWAGGTVAQGLLDAYPLPAVDPLIEISAAEIKNRLGAEISTDEIAAILTRLQFKVSVNGDIIKAQTPPHRLDIGEGLIGKSDLTEEIARIYGYDRIPVRRLAKDLPAQTGNPLLDIEEALRDLMANAGLQEIYSYRMVSPQREARRLPAEARQDVAYLGIINPISAERTVMRRSILSSMLETLEFNCRHRPHLALFEIGPVFIPQADEKLPDEQLKLAIGMTGKRQSPNWNDPNPANLDFFDLKGVIETLVHGLHLPNVTYRPADNPSFHPGKCAELWLGDQKAGVFGELHPLVKANYRYEAASVLAAEIDLNLMLPLAQTVFNVDPIYTYPPILEDIALIVDEEIPAAQLESLIWQAGGSMLRGVKLFDIFRGEQIGTGKKSMAYSLTYQLPDRTLNDEEAAKLRNKIVQALETALGAKLRSL